MYTCIKAINGIRRLADPKIRIELENVRKEYYKLKNIPYGTKLPDELRKELCRLWADYLIEIGGNDDGIQQATRD